MEFLDLVEKRYSVRAYKDEVVEDEKLKKILKAALLAPTAHNKQAFKIVVINTKEHQEELKKIYPSPYFIQAPIVLGIFSIPGESWVRKDGKNYADVDAAIVMDHIVMEATALGLGTCWIANFNSIAASEIIGLGEGYEPIVFTPIGYAEPKDLKKIRKTLEEIVVYL
ncbi:nitroreductase family protein [Clostridium estertheticum]|uniref:nitroreductase family protein n=1 Tax=Clostridium estertheticum TaxID=238834 RepID=UPI001C7DB7EF|nr:nitroreductase family protein [Clostridium estertheticum]MBX4264457.1 nitroreductase family protein [Clostridium estertheticum]MBX4271318.1 nitroreductase family protein [Clostridium estertheticum]WLC78268.1 nitroreductase family protein [Clostridium estertheticum]WLC89296.1 nitroreductase family protein [Clostridium estertheticum]